MARTLDGIVAAHTAAAARRAAERPVWDETIQIKKYLNNDDLSFGQIRDRVAQALRASRWVTKGDETLRMAVENLEEATDEDDFNAALDEVYDLADTDRVWLG